MEYVVEIANPGGKTAVKEYEATSAYALLYVVNHDLRSYPAFRVVNAWRKGEPDKRVYISQN
jgi:hypothetical protein